MNAGYLSAEAYSALKPKTRLYELSLSDCDLYPDKIAKEIKQLFENEKIFKALCGLEQMEECLFYNDMQPYKLLKTLLASSDKAVLELLSLIGYRSFLHDYIFCSIDSLKTRVFITENKINSIRDFIIKYEEAFTQLYSRHNVMSNNLPVETISTQTLYNTDIVTDIKFVEESLALKVNYKNLKRTRINIDVDALSISDYKKYVIYLSQLNDDEFEPFKSYMKGLLENVPVRTHNGIRSIGYQDFCINYLFAKDSKLLSIPGFGKKSVYCIKNKIKQQLIDYVITKYEQSDKKTTYDLIAEKEQNKVLPGLTLREILGESQYSILNKILYSLTKSSSERAKNGIANYHGDFIEHFVHNDSDIKELKNIGRKTEEEISVVVQKIRYISDRMIGEELSPEEVQLIEYKIFYGDCLDEFVREYYLIKGHLPMFHVLGNLIKSYLKSIKWRIFDSCCSFFGNNESKTLKEIAVEYNLSRERCRQICRECEKELHTICQEDLSKSEVNYSKIISNKDEWNYITDIIKKRDFIDTSIIQPILKEENCGLSLDFGFLVLSLLLDGDFVHVGRNLFTLPTRVKQKWSNTYLIKHEYADSFRFNDILEIIEDTENSLYKDIEIDTERMVIDTLFTAWNDFDTDKVSVVSEILSHILIQECGKIPNESLQFTLVGRKVLVATDIIYKILHDNGNPMKIDDIFSELEVSCPNRYKSPSSIKSLVADDPRICMVGTANLVGLSEWNHIKVGSIRDIIVQYLSGFDEPQPIAKIVEYVQQYRETSENSIRSTMGSGDQFSHFNGGFFGLKDKKYASCYGLPEKRRSYSLRLNEFECFLKENLHFPFSQSEDSTENSLYSWWRRVLKSVNLTEDQQSEIKRIQQQYKDLPTTRRDNEWYELYKKYIKFLQNYGRKPTRYNASEKTLYHWFEKSLNDFEDGILTSSQEKLYVGLCKLL
ncbi:MAG: hypothetical protein LUC26_00840 [Prevotella sp.]|nr:hypothetical protein [Prevotella sp.]